MDATQYRVEVHPALVPLTLEVAVDVCCLLDRGVAQLVPDPPEIRTSLQQPGGERVPRGMPSSAGELRRFQERLPDALEKGSVASNSADGVGEDEIALLRAQVLERGYEGLVGKDEASLYREGPTLSWLKVKQPHYREGERGWEPTRKS